MEKIKILVLSIDNDGVGYYRINSPYLTINDPDIEVDFKTSIDNSFNLVDEKFLQQYRVIVTHKAIPILNETHLTQFMEILKKNNIKLIFDIDDYWVLDSTHINYKQWVKKNSAANVIKNLKVADVVTTTTPYLANEIKQHNPNVEVFENAVNHVEQQWIPNKIESDKIRFIWGGGITHLFDLRLVKESISNIDKHMLNKMQMIMCGFDMRMTSSTKVLKDDPRKSMWGKFEDIFTNGMKLVKNFEYHKWLKEYDDISRDLYGYNEQYKDEFYQRRWTKPILLYGTMYNEADVALAPLKSSKFNIMKSQLKVIEAGAHRMPIIASDFGAYQYDIVDGKHGFLIGENDKKGWYDKMKYFIDNPNAVTDMGNELHELILSKYTLQDINKKRVDFIKNLIK